MDCSPPGFSVHGISQARILEWVAISFSRSSQSPDQTHVSCTGRILYHWTTWEALTDFYHHLNQSIFPSDPQDHHTMRIKEKDSQAKPKRYSSLSQALAVWKNSQEKSEVQKGQCTKVRREIRNSKLIKGNHLTYQGKQDQYIKV